MSKELNKMFESRERLLSVYTKLKTRPWIACEVVFHAFFPELGLSYYTEHDPDREDNPDPNATTFLDGKTLLAMEDTALISKIGIPDIGLDFVVNQAMIGIPTPVIKYANINLDLIFPAAPQNKDFIQRNGSPVEPNVSKYLGQFGAFYEDQFNSFGTLRIRRVKPTAQIMLVIKDRYDDPNRGGVHDVTVFPLYEFTGCRFTLPIPRGGDTSSQSALVFNVSIAFDNYKIMEFKTSSVDTKVFSKESVIAKAKLNVIKAERLIAAIGAAQGINF